MNTVIMWGPSASGKTALLAQLYLRSQASDESWQVFATKQSDHLIKRESHRIGTDNFFPLGTQVAAVGDEQKITYDFKQTLTGAEFSLETIDRAGKMYEDLPEEIQNSLRDAEAMILMVDHRRELHDSELREALRQVHLARDLGTRKDRRPVAVCLAKADQLIEKAQDYRRALDDPDGFVRPHLDEELLKWIDQHYANYKLFPVSSVGLRLSYGRIQRSVFFDENFQLRVSRIGVPIHHLTPFTWVFEELSRGV